METVGVLLLADKADQYLATLTAASAAETKLGAAASAAVSDVNALDASAGRAAQAAGVFGQASDTAATDAALLGTAAGTAASDVTALGADAAKAGQGVGDLGDDAKKAGKGTEDLGENAKKGASGLDWLKETAIGAARELGGKLLNAAQEAGQAIVQFIGDSISKAGDFEQQMNRFASVTGDALAESGTSLEQFKDLFISLGRELPVSTAAVQQAAIEMAKGGIDPATIAAGGLRDVLNLAAAGELEIADAAEIASKQMGVWVGVSASAAEKSAFLTQSVDLLSQAANASTVDVGDLALGLSNTGKVADIAGLSFRETVTTMAMISSGFSSAADAGTSLKTLLSRLQPTTNSAADAFKSLNLLTAEGKSVFYDATGAFIGMDKAAGILQQSLAGMSDAQKTTALTAAFGSDAIRAAAMIAEGGAAGYEKMAAEMLKAGSAAVQAAKKQQGFNVAMDNAGGSLEALQIVVASAALPALTSLVNAGAGAINMFTDFADATMQGKTALSAIGAILNAALVPAIAAAGAATLAYAYTQIPALLLALPGLIATVSATATAFIAQAAAVALAAAPFVVIAAAVGGVVLVLGQLQQKTQDATTALLESRDWWNASTDAIDRQAAAVGTAKTALAPYAAEIDNIRTAMQKEIQDLATRDAAGLVTDQQRTTEMANINALSNALIIATNQYTAQEAALNKATAASMTATAQSATMASAMPLLSSSVALTTQEIDALGKQIQKTFQDGQTALSAYATNYSSFATGVETRSSEFSAKLAELEKQKQDATTQAQKTGIDDQIAQLKASYADQEEAAAKSYADQQAAQTKHLGQMLIDYTVAQAQLGNITKIKAAEITAALEKEYGLQESSTATTFLTMAQSIDSFATSSGSSVNQLIGDLRSNQTAAKETQKAMDDYAKEYVATQTNNFLAGKSDVKQYTSALESIPREVQTTLTINENRVINEAYRKDERAGRAIGGPMDAMGTYLTGEKGPELVTPTTASYVTPNDALQRAMASQNQMSNAMRGATTNNVSSSVTYQMPIYTNQSPAVLQQSLAIVEAMTT